MYEGGGQAMRASDMTNLTVPHCVVVQTNFPELKEDGALEIVIIKTTGTCHHHQYCCMYRQESVQCQECMLSELPCQHGHVDAYNGMLVLHYFTNHMVHQASALLSQLQFQGPEDLFLPAG